MLLAEDTAPLYHSGPCSPRRRSARLRRFVGWQTGVLCKCDTRPHATTPAAALTLASGARGLPRRHELVLAAADQIARPMRWSASRSIGQLCGS